MNRTSSSPAWFDEAILIYGPRKAGTTLYQNLLDGTPGLFAFPVEMKLKAFARLPASAPIAVKDYLALSRIAELDHQGLSKADYLAYWQGLPDQALPLKKLIGHDLAALARAGLATAAVTCWSAKEVGGDTSRIIAKWFEMFPEGRVLFIVRDPLMVTRAVLNDRRRKGIRLPFWRIMRETCDPMRVVRAELAFMDRPGVMTIAYEDLVEAGEAVMRQVAAFLGLAFSQAMLSPTLIGERAVVATASRPEERIFRSEAAWSDGLTLREKVVVALTHRLVCHLPRFRVRYPQLRGRIGQARPPAPDWLAQPR